MGDFFQIETRQRNEVIAPSIKREIHKENIKNTKKKKKMIERAQKKNKEFLSIILALG